MEFGGRCELAGERVRIPRRAVPAGGSDGHLGVIDQKKGWSYDFWQVRERPENGGRLQVSYGGKTKIGKPGSDGRGSNATAGHFATAAGTIRPDELRAGLIDHALFMTVSCTSGRSVWPAGSGTGSSCGGGLGGLTAPAMGQHFFLKMTRREIDALPVPQWQKTILTAMADYGMYVGRHGRKRLGAEALDGPRRPRAPGSVARPRPGSGRAELRRRRRIHQARVRPPSDDRLGTSARRRRPVREPQDLLSGLESRSHTD